jgi:hypothetical protein
VCAAFVAINQSAVHWRPVMPDDYLFAYYGWRTSEGARPYLDVWDNKPPGIWWVNAAGFLLCGPGRGAEVLICAVALAAVLGGTLAIVRMACGGGAVLPAALLAGPVLTALAYECGADRTETFVAACDATGVALYLSAFAGGGTRGEVRAARRMMSFAAAGVVLGAGVVFKQSGAAAAMACVVHAAAVCAWRCVRGQQAGLRGGAMAVSGAELACLLASAALPGLTALVVLGWQGAIAAAWQAVVVHNRLYFEHGDASWTAISHAVRQYVPWLRPLTPVGLMAATIWAVCAAYRVRAQGEMPTDALCADAAGGEAVRDTSRAGAERAEEGGGVFAHALTVVVLWLLATAYLLCVAIGRQNYHLAPVLTPAVLLAALPLAVSGAFRGSLAAAVQRPVAACVVVLMGAAGGAVFLADLPSLRAIWARKPAWWAMSESSPRSEQELAERIRGLAGAEDTVYVWGWNPGVYRFTYRPNAVRFATNDQAQHLGAAAAWIEDEVEATLLARPPAVFVISEGEWGGLCASRRELAELFVREYEYVGTMHDKRVFARHAKVGR